MAIDLTGISNVNEFYSHHYLDSLLEGDLKGLYRKWKETDDRSPYEKLSGIANKYFKAKTDAFNEKKPEDRVEITRKLHIKFLEALGYEVNQVIKYSEGGQAIPVITSEKRDGNEYLWVLETIFWSDDTSVFELPLVLENNEDEVSWFDDSIDMAIQDIFRLDEPPRWLVLLAAQKAYLIDRNKWGQGKYLLFDLDELFGRKQAETLKATAALLSKDALAPEEGNVLHDELDENSHKHAFSVSEDLKYGIRRAVELIGNEFIYYRSKISKQKVYGDEELADKLTKESLSYLYRLLFLFYAESRSEELNVVPMKSEEYRLGYSLETLRELEQVPLTTEASREGYFLHESLTTLFKIVNDGFGYDDQFEMDYESGNYVDFGFNIDGLQSPLFNTKETPLLSSVKFRNFVLQEVIQLLSLSKEGNKQRGRISYAQLGINQLGAVYEGLLSYSGFFAQETLYEVKPANVSSTDETGQSYFVPGSDIEQYKEDEFVLFKDEDGVKRRKKYERGSFIFRLAGRDREKSASYYTPEVLTRTLVRQSLSELLKGKNADEILGLTICEPAMGSGAFLNESINQLADAYLERKQIELGKEIHTDDYIHQKQKVKSYIATNNIYGVDLNPTATELAKVSLWLNTIYNGSNTPWFANRLSVGNSLIGIKKAVYFEDDIISDKWKNKLPKKISLKQNRKNDTIYHFLLPNKNMVQYENDSIIKDIAPENVKNIRKWKENFNREFDLSEIKSLREISNRIDDLWNRHYRNEQRVSKLTRDNIVIWGSDEEHNEEKKLNIEQKDSLWNSNRNSEHSPYNALKLVMDYWCALWFWPIEKTSLLPTRDEFLLEISTILDSAEGFGPSLKQILSATERLGIVAELSEKLHFFHYELEFTSVFIKGGFDLIIGNPPWGQIKWESDLVLSDFNPLLSIRKNLPRQEKKEIYDLLLKEKKDIYFSEFEYMNGLLSFLQHGSLLHEMKKLKPNYYKPFIFQGFHFMSEKGIQGLVHGKGIYDENKAGDARKFLYKKLIYRFQFWNQLKLFDIGNARPYFLSIFRNETKRNISFYSISNLFHPKTIEESLKHKEKNDVPGLKDEQNNWELRGHKDRIIKINDESLKVIRDIYEKENDDYQTVYFPEIHAKQLLKISERIAGVDSFNERFVAKSASQLLSMKNSIDSGFVIRKDAHPRTLDKMFIQGPQISLCNMYFQEPRVNCKNFRDYEKIRIEDVDDEFIPRCTYWINDITVLNEQQWNHLSGFRIAHRKMVDLMSERTLMGAIIPPHVAHSDSINSIQYNNEYDLVLVAGYFSSIVYDSFIRQLGKTNLRLNIFNYVPSPKKNEKLEQCIINRSLLLNCVTKYFSPLFDSLFDPKGDSWARSDLRLKDSFKGERKWSKNKILLNDYERRQALLEIDVLAALSLDIKVDELVVMYNSQFPVLKQYENKNYYDQFGRLVPNNVVKYYTNNFGTVSHNDSNLEGYKLPFEQCDREADMRQAYEHFSKIAKGEVNV
ncbi:Eco57I restriction-modification methylase domain-containing protein [Aquibacillus albus]|uniref:site-specific DNA-methyltransferase (adenine-specific) n=1 Tax=Aquibacillus albus TaxID=1168171 RepID=A0ABS2N491_9BACI|nr:N-6 DNA methylase [Aquibacillus albus]MBM7572942.1 hypothetical protein [Aquibacillus albus]